MNSLYLYLTAHWVDITAALTLLVGAARIIVKLTPTPEDDTLLASLITFLTHIGLKLPLIGTLLLGGFLVSCNTTTQTVTVRSPDGTVTTTVTASKTVDSQALQSSAEIAGDAAAVYLKSQTTLP